MSAEAGEAARRWRAAWPDALAFAGGLAVAWFAHWRTTDLVWSLWLSSLVVGYTLIVWMLSAPLREVITGVASDPAAGEAAMKAGAIAVTGGMFLFGLAFFTVHFGMFHFVHSVFLNYFFPVEPGVRTAQGFPTPAVYGEVARRYWMFVPLAFLAERQAFRRKPATDVAVTPAAIANRKLRGDAMMEPYRNVIRLHLLIFFFVFAHVARLENFAVYAVVYAAYFFPWRLVRQQSGVLAAKVS